MKIRMIERVEDFEQFRRDLPQIVASAESLLVTVDGPELICFWLGFFFARKQLGLRGLDINQLGNVASNFTSAERELAVCDLPPSRKQMKDIDQIIGDFARNCGLAV